MKPTRVEVGEEGVEVDWEGGHSSTYSFPWLTERSFREEARARSRELVGGWSC